MITIRPAERSDLLGIMEVERQTFGAVGEDAMASLQKMEARIDLLNSANEKWFWVAVAKDGVTILGDMILQPTDFGPEECTSWSAATNDGSLQGTFSPDGKNIYVVSLAVSQRSAADIVSMLLVHASAALWARHGGLYLFCSRMPGFAQAHAETGIDPEEYIRLEHRGAPRDPMLRLYWRMTGGVRPFKLLRNGFPPDEESGGHGVLFVLRDPVKALLATGSYLAAGARAVDP
jgi:hypothetical protein